MRDTLLDKINYIVYINCKLNGVNVMNNLYKICFTKEKTDWEKYFDFFTLFSNTNGNFYFENKEKFKSQEECEGYLNFLP